MATALTRWMRTHQKKMLAVLCALIMVIWSVEGPLSQLLVGSPAVGGSVFGESVSGWTLNRLMKGLQIIAPQSVGNDRNKLYGLAWETVMLAREAERRGLVVSDEEVESYRNGWFSQGQGAFDGEAYVRMLGRYGVTVSDFEVALKEYILGRKALMDVQMATVMSTPEAWRWWSWTNSRAKIRYAFVDAKQLEPLVDPPTKDEIASQYETGKLKFADEAPNGAGYRKREKIKMEYLLVDVAALEKDIAVTEEEAQKRYDANKESYRLPETEKKTDEKAAPETPKAEEPKADATEAKPADKPADEPADKAAAEKAAEKPAEKKDEGPKYRPFAEVREQIEKEIRREKARAAAEEIRKKAAAEIDRLRDVPFGSTVEPIVDFKKLAATMKLKYRETDWFGAEDLPRILPGSDATRKIRQYAFRNTESVKYQPRYDAEADEGLVIYQVTDVQLAAPAPLDEVRDKVIADVKRNKAVTLAANIVDSAVAKQGKNGFDAVLAEIKAKVDALAAKAAPAEEKKTAEAKPAGADDAQKTAEAKPAEPKRVVVGESGFFRRPMNFRGQMFSLDKGVAVAGGNDAGLADAAFALKFKTPGVYLEPSGGAPGAYALEVVDMERPGPSEYAAAGQAQYPRLVYDKSRAEFAMWQADLVSRAKPSNTARKGLASLEMWSDLVK